MPCDHSNEKRRAYIGRHKFLKKKAKSYYSIPIIDVLFPEPGNQVFSFRNERTHDFALMILKTPVTFSKTVCPICLPQRDQEFPGIRAISAGWGQHKISKKSTQSRYLRKVTLTVDDKKYKHYKMIGTLLEINNGVYKDPCAGDSGRS